MPTPFPSGQEEVVFSGVCLGARKLGYCCLHAESDLPYARGWWNRPKPLSLQNVQLLPDVNLGSTVGWHCHFV